MICKEQYNGVTINKCGPGSSWRFVHDFQKVITMPFESDGITGTIHTLFEAASEMECLAEIERLGIALPEETGGLA
jgi:hypothetical protein